MPQPSDAVDKKLQSLMRLRSADGSLAAEVDLWQLDEPRVVDELVLLGAQISLINVCYNPSADHSHVFMYVLI